MRERVLGPYRGYYIAVTCLVMGELADRYSGFAGIYDHTPAGSFERAPLHSFTSERLCTRVEEALDCAEDEAFAYIDDLPEREAAPLTTARLDSLIYVSRAQRPLQQGDLEHLLVAARRRNAMYGVTGVLLYFDEAFMQYIEGPAPHLALIYRIIRRDPLHGGVNKIMQQEIAERVFGAWSMAFDMPGASALLPTDVRPMLAPQQLDASTVQAVLSMFLHRHSVNQEVVASALKLRPR